MKRTIWKYPLAITTRQLVRLPTDFKILHIGMQSYQLTMWVDVPASPWSDSFAEILVFGTGDVFDFKDRDVEHLATVHDGAFIWHVFRNRGVPYLDEVTETVEEVKENGS